MSLSKWFSSTEGDSKVERFRKLSKGKTPMEIRKLEKTLLQPEQIPPYGGPMPPSTAVRPLSDLTIKLVFPNRKKLAVFEKHFSISHHIEQSVTNIDLLLALMKALDKGRIVYDKDTKRVLPRHRRRNNP